MEIIYPSTLIPTLKDCHLLLDANVFRDSTSKPSLYNNFFTELKNAAVTLCTIDPVKFELLKGSANDIKYAATEKTIKDFTQDVVIPVQPKTYDVVYDLIKKYGIEGTPLSITDLIIGAVLMQYKKNIFLMTRDTTDFTKRIFKLCSVVNIPNSKGIFTYGIYQYSM
ncbi:MAG TPA: type II toxin-antitoxin system VapC family toxin [Patescibacteria group bacterium]|nr:type II toxin-antitoxin system VapC family toxin [Patescibacteria group bacterium]